MLIDDQDRLLVVGEGWGAVIVARLEWDGTVDTSYGVDGLAEVQLAATGVNAMGSVLQPDQRLLLIAQGAAASDYEVIRLDADGGFDPGFGVGGRVSEDPTGDTDQALGIALQDDGSVWVCGHSGYRGLLVKYQADGQRDGSISGDGIRLTIERYNSDGSPDSSS